jgi:integrase
LSILVASINAGLRLSELLGLNWTYVDLSRGVIRLDDHEIRAAPRAAVVAIAKLDDVNFHTRRHTFASWAVMRGVTLKELQELLEHSCSR